MIGGAPLRALSRVLAGHHDTQYRRQLMFTIEQHTLIAVDASGSLCACGVKGDYLEHVAVVRLLRAFAWIASRQEVTA